MQREKLFNYPNLVNLLKLLSDPKINIIFKSAISPGKAYWILLTDSNFMNCCKFVKPSGAC